jgi:hypothetical protein
MISQYDTPFRFENIVICAAARVSFKIQNERTHLAVCDGLASSFAPQLRRSANACLSARQLVPFRSQGAKKAVCELAAINISLRWSKIALLFAVHCLLPQPIDFTQSDELVYAAP